MPYVTIRERIESAGVGGSFTMGWTTYLVRHATMLQITNGEFVGMLLHIERSGGTTRGYMYTSCDVCGEKTLLRWSFKSENIVRKVGYCLTCYNRYQKRKAVLYEREPVHGRNVVLRSRLPQLDVVRIVTGSEKGVIKPLWNPAF